MIVSPQMYEMQELCMITTTTAMLHDVAISSNQQSISDDQPSVSNNQQSISIDESKRSTFDKTVEIVSLTSRKLEVPHYMYTTPKAKRIYIDELHRLFAEIKVRIDDCHVLVDSKNHKQSGGAE
ncbi:unnamed protein product [Onchocerca ochengi]|nr:unnamed protein product [Onchocerca ochengi]